MSPHSSFLHDSLYSVEFLNIGYYKILQSYAWLFGKSEGQEKYIEVSRIYNIFKDFQCAIRLCFSFLLLHNNLPQN